MEVSPFYLISIHLTSEVFFYLIIFFKLYRGKSTWERNIKCMNWVYEFAIDVSITCAKYSVIFILHYILKKHTIIFIMISISMNFDKNIWFIDHYSMITEFYKIYRLLLLFIIVQDYSKKTSHVVYCTWKGK